MLISAPGGKRFAGVPGSLLGALAPAGSPLPRTPAGVFAAFRSNQHAKKSTITFNTAKNLKIPPLNNHK
jgi:hypothetical protein